MYKEGWETAMSELANADKEDAKIDINVIQGRHLYSLDHNVM